jgi:hypothetical protein
MEAQNVTVSKENKFADGQHGEIFATMRNIIIKNKKCI